MARWRGRVGDMYQGVTLDNPVPVDKVVNLVRRTSSVNRGSRLTMCRSRLQWRRWSSAEEGRVPSFASSSSTSYLFPFMFVHIFIHTTATLPPCPPALPRSLLPLPSPPLQLLLPALTHRSPT
eukprot:331531-Hanusia_phi.AAC.1